MVGEIKYRDIYCATCQDVTSHVEVETIDGPKYDCEVCNTTNATHDETLTMHISVQSEIVWSRDEFESDEEWQKFVTRMQDIEHAKEVAIENLDVAFGNIESIDETEVTVLKVKEGKKE